MTPPGAIWPPNGEDHPSQPSLILHELELGDNSNNRLGETFKRIEDVWYGTGLSKGCQKDTESNFFHIIKMKLPTQNLTITLT
jgi:hypothetical protein